MSGRCIHCENHYRGADGGWYITCGAFDCDKPSEECNEFCSERETKEDAERLLTERLTKLLPDWKVMPCGGFCWEVERHSPAGEDVIVTLRGESMGELAECADDCWQDFDAELHAAEIFMAKRNGSSEEQRFYAAAPDSLQELLRDAEAVDKMYESVCVALKGAEEEEA